MAGRTVSANNFSAALAELLQEYGESVNKVAAESVKDIAKDTAKELKATAPNKTGAYAKSWSYKPVKVSGMLTEYTVYAKAPHYRLTHLLENGHTIKNQAGSYGTVAAKPHIAQAEQKAIKDLEDKIRGGIEKL